jgi:hypothetical protein
VGGADGVDGDAAVGGGGGGHLLEGLTK